MKDEKELYELFGKCPYVTVQKLISGKWSVLILHYLSDAILRFGELQRKLPGITQATLTKQLRRLESDGLIVRHVYAEVPPKVEYEMTEIGKEIIPILEQVGIWGEKYIAYMKSEEKMD